MNEVPKIVISRLAQQAQVGAPDLHPDANLLAAFGERSLPAPDRAQITEHLTKCLECREVLALATPEQVTAPLLSQPAVARWSSWPVLRWGTALACIVVVGAAVSLRQHEAHKDSSLQEMMQRPAAEESRQSATIAGPGNSLGSGAVVPSQPSEIKPENGSRPLQGQHTLATSRAMAAAPSLALPVNPKAEASQDPDLEEDMANIDLDSLVPGRAKDALDSPLPLPGTSVDRNTVVAEQSVSAMLLSSPNLAPRWALTSDGSLQRSVNSGRSWDVIPISSQGHFHALAANGLEIWVGGASGALFHSSDAGQHWMQIQPAENGRPLTADIIGVEFPDMEHGHVNTSTGEVWVTDDAGFTWKKQ